MLSVNQRLDKLELQVCDILLLQDKMSADLDQMSADLDQLLVVLNNVVLVQAAALAKQRLQMQRIKGG